MNAREYLKNVVRTEEEVKAFVCPEVKADPVANNLGWTFSPELGWVLKDSVREDGVDGSRTFYHYEECGARKKTNAAGLPCRIHSYGDSFTHCDQVSDGETWQEYLAAHLREPIENYGVGGYSVYQAYLRMLLIERARPAECIVFNIWDDDHYRSLDAWRAIRFGRKTQCGYTLPHLRVDLAKRQCTEMPNPCRRAEEVVHLADLDYAEKTFADDPVLQTVLATRTAGAGAVDEPMSVPVSFGLDRPGGDEDDRVRQLKDAHTRAALFSSCRVIDWLERFAAETHKRVLIVLSHGTGAVREALTGRPWWDRTFVDYLKTKAFGVVDLREAHVRDYARHRIDVDDYLSQYYIGHYSPRGNYFHAWAIKDPLLELLDPKPLPYR